MHLGVFVLGAGNHSAGWRWEGAAVSNNDLRFFANRAAKKWPLRGSLKQPAGSL
jgi:hypothetical protein